ncbi:MAG: sigma-70 family RNA polymerase sigma factor [Planctomycetota bacterium]
MRARAIDPDLILAHDGFVRRLARRLLRDAHAADDVAQQTWMAACTRAVTADSLRDWLVTVARRIAGRRVRSDRRESLRQRAAARSEQLPSTAAIVEREALRAAITRAVIDLAEPYRTVVLLRWYEDLPPRAIARRLGLPVETVRTRHRRALAELRLRLDHHAGGDRRAWCALLLPLTRKSLLAADCAASPSFTAGVMLMSLSMRHALAAVVVAGVVAFTIWMGSQSPSDPPNDPATPAAGPAPLEARLARPTPEAKASTAEVAARRTPLAGETTRSGSLLVRTLFHDGSPAAGVEIELARDGDAGAWSSPRGRTDANGETRFADQAPGTTIVLALRPDLAASRRGEVHADRETVVELTVARGIDAHGIVVDATGAPVADAEIVAADWSGREGHVVGRSATDGTFALRSMSGRCHIGARAPAYSASPMHTVTASDGARVELRLVLSQPAATVTGMVFGPDGQPVLGATVRVGSERQDNRRLADGTQAMGPRPTVVRTDRHGRFAATSLPAGQLPCTVLVPNLAPWQDTFDVAAGERREVTVHLQPGVMLSGKVRDAGGNGVAGASVRIGEWLSPVSQQRTTDATGTFAFTGLPVGELTAAVDHDLGRATTTLQGSPGQALRWDPVLSAGLVLRGRVVGDDGRPIARAHLRARVEPGHESSTHWSSHATSGEDGRFRLENCAAGTPIRIEVRRHSMCEMVLRAVVPSDDELTVRMPSIAWVRVRGVAVGVDGKPCPNVEIQVLQPGAGGDLETLDPATGAFDVGPYPPGELRLALKTSGLAPIRLRRDVAPGETWDLGTVAFAHGGTLVVEVAADDAAVAEAVDGATATIADDQGAYVDFVRFQDRRAIGGPWAAGDYVLQVVGKGIAAVRRPFAIRVDEVTKLELTARGGVATEVTCRLPAGAVADSVPLEVLDVEDEVVLRANARPRAHGVVMNATLGPGRYTVRATAEASFAGETQLDVIETGQAQATIELRTRN